MTKWVLLSVAVCVEGCSGATTSPTTRSAGTTTGTAGTTTGGSTTGSTANTLSGKFAFVVGKAIDVSLGYSDGGLDPVFVEVDLTNDSGDSCLNQEGYPDGGLPSSETEEVEAVVVDPNGVQAGTGYQSLTTTQEEIYLTDGGLPSTAYAQVFYFDSSNSAVSIGGTVTLSEDATTEEVDANFNVTLVNTADGTESSLSGNGTPPAMCWIEFSED